MKIFNMTQPEQYSSGEKQVDNYLNVLQSYIHLHSDSFREGDSNTVDYATSYISRRNYHLDLEQRQGQ